MIYKIYDKKIVVKLKNEIINLPLELNLNINKHFEDIVKTGAKIWNGDVLCVSEYSMEDDKLEIICKKTNYAHYLYGERVGCEHRYECKNLSAGCLLETSDGYYIVGELDENTSYPKILQVPGGGIDKRDIVDDNIDIENVIIRETIEELNIDLNNKKNIISNVISYLYVSEKNEQPGIEVFSKAKINMSADELKNHFNDYYKYLKENDLELEFKRLHFLKKENAIKELENLNNPKRNYLIPLLQKDLEGF